MPGWHSKVLAKCPAAAFLQGELKKTGKKRKPSQTSQKASQEPTKTSQKASQEQAKPARKPARSQSKPARKLRSQAKPARKPARSQAKPARKPARSQPKPARKPSQASQKPTKKKPARVSFEGARLAETKAAAGHFAKPQQPHGFSGRIESIWETPSKERGAMFCVRAFARRSLQLSLQSLRSSRSLRRNSTRNSTRAAPKKWLVPVSSSEALRKHKCHLCFRASHPRHLTRQPAESYGSYGSYGHTVAVWHSGCTTLAPPARHRSPCQGRNSSQEKKFQLSSKPTTEPTVSANLPGIEASLARHLPIGAAPARRRGFDT